MCKIWRQSDKYFQRYAPETKCLRTAQRRNINIFASATLRIEFRIKIFEPVHYPPGSNPHTKNCYPSFFSYKVIGKRRGKNQNGIHSNSNTRHFFKAAAAILFPMNSSQKLIRSSNISREPPQQILMQSNQRFISYHAHNHFGRQSCKIEVFGSVPKKKELPCDIGHIRQK